MRSLAQVIPLNDSRLAVTFGNGEKKVADLKPFLSTEVFQPLQNPTLFNAVKNKEYFVEWLDGEVDLSADTLWHIGVLADYEL